MSYHGINIFNQLRKLHFQGILTPQRSKAVHLQLWATRKLQPRQGNFSKAIYITKYTENWITLKIDLICYLFQDDMKLKKVGVCIMF